jgi:histone deacetylase 6
VDKTYLEKYTENEITTRTKDIMCYLWDNYLENYDTQEITLMGVGESYQGVKQLLTNRDCKDKITSVLNFVTGSLRPVRSETDSELSSWYRTHSRVYVSSDHACWNDPDSQRKIKKNRFGKLFCSDQIGLNRMMARHMNDATDWILEEAGIEKDDVAM